ncbi:hypothetical protein BsWGS_06686 [Bradybaena similaris]
MADSQHQPEMPAEQMESREASPDVPPEQIISRQASSDMSPGDIDSRKASSDVSPGDIDSRKASSDVSPGDIDSRKGTSDVSPGNIETGKGTSDAPPGGMECRHGSPDAPPGGMECRHGSPDAPPGGMECRHGSPDAPPGGMECRHGSPDAPPGGMECRHGSPDAPPGGMECRHGSPDAPPGGMECRHGSPDAPPEGIEIESRQGSPPAVIDNNARCQVRRLRSELDLVASLYRVSEGRCANYQREIRELKEQLAMYRSASQLGVFAVQPLTSATAQDEATSATAQDEATSATARDEATSSTARDESTESPERTPSSDELVASLRAELERCLRSNRQRSAEVLEKMEETRILREDLTVTRTLADRMNNLCTELQTAVNIMARHQVQFENMHRQVLEVAEENECYRIALEKVQEAKSRQDDVVASLIAHISGMHERYELEKRFALEMFKQAMEERQKETVDKQTQDLDSAKSEMNNIKYLFSKVCVESTVKDAQVKTFLATLLAKLRKVQEIKVDCVVEQWQVMQEMLEEIMNDVHQMCQRDRERPGSSQDVEQLAAELCASTSAVPKYDNELD